METVVAPPPPEEHATIVDNTTSGPTIVRERRFTLRTLLSAPRKDSAPDWPGAGPELTEPGPGHQERCLVEL